jgi:pimeloyl-ACP methyl ester carboxylesterase
VRAPRLIRELAALLLVVLVAAPATAQEQAVVFVHGLASSGATWTDTANRLGQELSVQTRTPDLPWSQGYADQAAALNGDPQLAGLSTPPIAVAHSNGGLVSRELARRRPLAGIVTIGTPHNGAPLIPQFYNWMVFQSSTSMLVNSTLSSFSRPSSVAWLMGQLAEPIGWIAGFGVWSVIYLAASIGIDRFTDVSSDMRPGSDALRSINSADNISREQAAVPARVGIVSVADDFYWAGPARAVAPDHADAIAVALYSTIGVLVSWGAWIFATADPFDFDAQDQASSLFALAGHLGSMDAVYCTLVSSTVMNECIPNDGIVPYTTQIYPGAPNVFLGFEGGGPAHLQQTRQADLLRDVLIHYLHVPPRSVAPPPPPPPPPGPPPPDDPPPDDPPPPTGESIHGREIMRVNERLYPHESLRSANGLYELVYQGDGNFVLYNEHGVPLWAADTVGTPPGYVMMQWDGTLIVRDGSGLLAFDTEADSGGRPDSYLVVQNDGNVVIYDSTGFPTWHTGTVQ